MTKKQKIERLNYSLNHLYFSLCSFSINERWEKYILCAMLIHEFEALIKELESS